MQLLQTRAELSHWLSRRGAAPLHFVPTMGALHSGHQSLIRRAALPRTEGQPQVLVSVFVNPLQFGPHEDFGRYPRNLEADGQLAAAAGAQALFAPAWRSFIPTGKTNSRAFGHPSRCNRGCAVPTAQGTSTGWPRWWCACWP